MYCTFILVGDEKIGAFLWYQKLHFDGWIQTWTGHIPLILTWVPEGHFWELLCLQCWCLLPHYSHSQSSLLQNAQLNGQLHAIQKKKNKCVCFLFLNFQPIKRPLMAKLVLTLARTWSTTHPADILKLDLSSWDLPFSEFRRCFFQSRGEKENPTWQPAAILKMLILKFLPL